jgi:predicted nucleic acid-binding protein
VKAADSSVVIAAFASWHEHHAIARNAMAARPRLIAHAAVEAYSVLTRLPPPHRASPGIVHAFITGRFTEPFLTLSETGYQELLATVAAGQILGGPAYDALIAFTAAEHRATLISLDQRAAATYETVGAQVEQLLS